MLNNGKKWSVIVFVSLLLLGTIALYAQIDPAGLSPGGSQAGQDPVSDQSPLLGLAWTTNPPIPFSGGLAQTTSAAVGGKLYIIGGGSGPALTPTNKVYEYDPDSGAYADKTPIPVTPGYRGFGAAVAYNDLIYVFGGFNGSNSLNGTYIYDPANDAWSQGANLPGPRFGSAVALVGDLIFVAGGVDQQFPGLADAYFYDPNKDTYTPIATMPTPRFRFHAAYAPDTDEVHAFGDFSVEANGHLVYNVGNNTWSNGTGMPFGVIDPVVVYYNSAIYILGGNAGTGVGRAQIYDPVANTYTQGPTAPSSADNVSGDIIDNQIFQVGGYVAASGQTVPYNYSLTVPE